MIKKKSRAFSQLAELTVLALTASIIMTISNPSSASAATSTPAEFKGYSDTNKVIETRLIKADSSFELSKYLGESSGGGPNLTDLMGSYDGTNLDIKFRNGVPNVINMTLWFLAIDALANDLGQICLGSLPPKSSAEELAGKLDIGFSKNLQALCQWPQPQAQTDQVMAAFWLNFAGYDEPITEYFAWKKFFLESEYKNAPAKEAIAAMAFAVLYNPYFLLNN